MPPISKIVFNEDSSGTLTVVYRDVVTKIPDKFLNSADLGSSFLRILEQLGCTAYDVSKFSNVSYADLFTIDQLVFMPRAQLHIQSVVN